MFLTKKYATNHPVNTLSPQASQELINDFSQGVQASFTRNNYIYIFKNDKYIRVNMPSNTVDAGYPKSIAKHWNLGANFSSNIDAAVEKSGYIYFFKGGQYVRFKNKNEVAPAKSIEKLWKLSKGFNTNIDGAISRTLASGSKKLYFFKGDKYIRFDVKTNKVDKGPTSMSVWKLKGGCGTNMDAAVSRKGRAYFFKGKQCAMFDLKGNKALSMKTLQAFHQMKIPETPKAPEAPKTSPNNYSPTAKSGTITVRNKESYAVKVFNAKTDELLATLSARGESGSSQTITVAEWSKLEFAPVSGDDEFPSCVISGIGGTYEVEAAEVFNKKDLRYGLPENDANFSSFDILYIDPFAIDKQTIQVKGRSGNAIVDRNVQTRRKGGMRKAIFASVGDGEFGWHITGGKIGEDFLNFESNDGGSCNTTTKMFYSATALKNNWNAELKIGGEKKYESAQDDDLDRSRKGMFGASFNYINETSSNETNVYTFGKCTHTVYDISLSTEKVRLTEDFKSAVMNLPKPEHIVENIEAAKANAAIFKKYEEFVKAWGTHYPIRVSYGGLFVQMTNHNQAAFSTLNEQSYNFTASASFTKDPLSLSPKASASVGHDYSLANNEVKNNSKTVASYRGGSGNSLDDWSVDEDNVEPIGIELARLHELLSASIFKDGTLEYELAPRRAMLKQAITDYLLRQSLRIKETEKPRVFAVKMHRLKVAEVANIQNSLDVRGFMTMYGFNNDTKESRGKREAAVFFQPKDNGTIRFMEAHTYAIGRNYQLIKNGKREPVDGTNSAFRNEIKTVLSPSQMNGYVMGKFHLTERWADGGEVSIYKKNRKIVSAKTLANGNYTKDKPYKKNLRVGNKEAKFQFDLQVRAWEVKDLPWSEE